MLETCSAHNRREKIFFAYRQTNKHETDQHFINSKKSNVEKFHKWNKIHNFKETKIAKATETPIQTKIVFCRLSNKQESKCDGSSTKHKILTKIVI